MKNYEIESKYELSAGLKLKSPKASRVEKILKTRRLFHQNFCQVQIAPINSNSTGFCSKPLISQINLEIVSNCRKSHKEM